MAGFVAHEFVVRTLLEHAALTQDDDGVARPDGREPMSDDESGASLRRNQAIDCSLHYLLACDVQRRRGLVE